ncbi:MULTISPECIES: AAA family ATPase [unclassified Luteococcus]|uniref:AAA family ATPase n=1 Tax=unclassified Luteococcus TaxID=2639923 RepID=UPI00313BCB14
MRPLQEIKIKGFASLREVSLTLDTPVTVLIGANGAGKSNVVRSLELLGELVDRNLQNYVVRRGGISRMVHHGAGGATSRQIELEVHGTPNDDGVWNGYMARLSAGEDDEVVLDETLLMQDTTKFQRPLERPLGLTRESRLRKVTGESAPMAFYVQDVLASCRVYHFDDVSQDAPPKQRSNLADNLELRRDAANLAAYLHRLEQEDPETYQRMVAAVRSVAPFFEDFVLQPDGAAADTILLRWRQKGCDEVFSAGQLSDGTLRFICLTTLLLSPHRPATVVLDEPELGLHPFAIRQLAELVNSCAGSGRRVILATQSVSLLEEFSLDTVAVVERAAGETRLNRPDAESLGEFLEDYSLGELWRMNLLGGRPTHEAVIS